MTRGFVTPGQTRPLPAVRPTTSTKPAEELQPFHTKDGSTIWLTQAEVDNLRLREFASEETGEIAMLAAMDIDGDGHAHYPPAHIEDFLQRIDAEADIRTRCKTSRKQAKEEKDGKPRRRYRADTDEWS